MNSNVSETIHLMIQLFGTLDYLMNVKSLDTISHQSIFNPFRLAFSEPKFARGGYIIFLESIFQYSPYEIVLYIINRKSYNKKVKI